MNAHCPPRVTQRYLLSPAKTYRFPILQRRLAAAGARCASARTSFRGECRGEIDTELVTHLKQARRDVRARTSSLVVAIAHPPSLDIVRDPVSFDLIRIRRSRGSQLQYSANTIGASLTFSGSR